MYSPRRLASLTLIASLLLSGGCSTVKGWFADDEDEASEPAPLVEFEPEMKVEKVWASSVGKGQGKTFNNLAPAISGDVLYAASTDGQVVALDKATGKRRWKQDLDLPITGAIGLGPDSVMVGSSDGSVIQLAASDGSERWRVVLDGEVLSAPQSDGRVVLVQTYNGKLRALDANDGSELWEFDSNLPVLTLRGTSTPMIAERLAIAAFATGKVVALDLQTGALRWEARVAVAQGRSEIDRIVDIDGHMLLLGNTLYVASYQGRVVAIDIAAGRKIWQQEASSYVGPDQGFGNIYVSDSTGSVVAYYRNGEGVRWEQPALENRRLSPPKTVRGYVVVGDLEGYLHFLDQVDGRFVGRIKVDGKGVRGRMLAEGNTLYVYSNTGKLLAYRVVGLDD